LILFQNETYYLPVFFIITSSLSIIFAAMANKLKKPSAPKAENKKESLPAKGTFKSEKEEKVNLKKLAKDERTRKIIGAVSVFISILLFLAFISYFFTWKEDQDKVFRGSAVLFDNELKVSNLLGRLGAYLSHFFIYKGFGIASMLFCSFFFINGINLLTGRRVYSFWKNLRYVIVGLLVVSVCTSFLFPNNDLPLGGGVGKMINNWLTGILGYIGAGALLFVAALGWFIWQFNPAFKMPSKTERQANDAGNEEMIEEHYSPIAGARDTYKKEETEALSTDSKANSLRDGNGVVVIPPKKKSESEIEFKIITKEQAAEETFFDNSAVEKSIIEEITHKDDLGTDIPFEIKTEDHDEYKPKEIKDGKHSADDFELEIKAVPAGEEKSDEEKKYENLAPYEPTLDLRDYKYPSLNMLETHGSEKIVQDPAELEMNKNQIINTLRNYDIEIQKISATVGPTVTLYEIVPSAGIRISRIKNLEDDIALNLAALGIRIIAPIPGKGTIGIEVPNVRKSVVSMKTLLASDKFQNNNFSLPIAIGKKIDNENYIVDLASMPHMLMAGATGQGKSVGLNAVLVSLLYKKHPSQLKFVLIDPKKVELSLYRLIEKHFLAKLPGEEEAIITDTKKVVHTLNALCIEMDNRYDLLKEAGARNIKEYNEKFIKRKLNPLKGHQFLPFIVLVIDEFADLIMTAGKEVEMPIARLAQLARAIGIHLIIATQRPSVNIITGTIKANFPSRIAFKVSSKIDSRTILDTGGAEQLIGKGDMLISHHGEVTRLQCAFVDTPEVEKVVEFIGNQRGYPQAFLLPEYIDEKELEGKDFDLADRDALFEDAARLIVQNQVGSTSLLQRRMKLGYNRAGRLMDQLENAGIVGPGQGSKARDVLIKTESDLNAYLQQLG
jgi:DNA segregation ATPase FtsK/SpoIIIE, S-DNA-T family